MNSLNDLNAKKEEADKKIKNYESNINILSSEMRIKDSKLKFLIETEKEKMRALRAMYSPSLVRPLLWAKQS